MGLELGSDTDYQLHRVFLFRWAPRVNRAGSVKTYSVIQDARQLRKAIVKLRSVVTRGCINIIHTVCWNTFSV